MLDVELAACEAMYEEGIIPEEDMEIIRAKADFDVDRIAEIEETTKHDVIAFLNKYFRICGFFGAMDSLRYDIFGCFGHRNIFTIKTSC